MIKLILDGEKIKSEAELHKTIGEQIPLPTYYGNNLAALNDVLSANTQDMEIYLLNQELLVKHLNQGAQGLLRLLHDLALHNCNITLKDGIIK
ncbi:MAG: barstar family protein [Clostridiales bacterium]